MSNSHLLYKKPILLNLQQEKIKPSPIFQTPTHSKCLTQRNSNISSHKKVIKMDGSKKTEVVQLQNKRKFIKMSRKKVQNFQEITKPSLSICSTSRKQSTKNKILFVEADLECFGDKKSMHQNQCDWNLVIKEKKKQLYSYLYKLDKHILSMERQIYHQNSSKKMQESNFHKQVYCKKQKFTKTSNFTIQPSKLRSIKINPRKK